MAEKDWNDIITYIKRAGIGALIIIVINIAISWNVHSYRINQIELDIKKNSAIHTETRERLIDFMPTINMRLNYIENDVRDIKNIIYRE